MAKRAKNNAVKQPSEDAPPAEDAVSNVADEPSANDEGVTQKQPRWSGGSWKGKSAAVAEVAKESISIAATRASEAVQSKFQPDTPSRRFSDRLRTPSKSSPTTQLSISSADQKVSTERPLATETPGATTATTLDGKSEEEEKEVAGTYEKSDTARGWGSWLGRQGDKGRKPGGTEANVLDSEVGAIQHDRPKNGEPATNSSVRSAISSGEGERSAAKTNSVTQIGDRTSDEVGASQEQTQRSRASWFGLWSSGAAEKDDSDSKTSNQKSKYAHPEASNVASDGFSALDEDQKLIVDETQEHMTAAQQPQSSWAFWSREPAKTNQSKQNVQDATAEVGEIAIENTASESKPKPAQVSETQSQEASAKSGSKKRDQPISTKGAEERVEGEKLKSTERLADSENQKTGEQGSKSTSASGDESSQTGVEAPTGDSASSLRKKIQKLQRPNLLLPALHNTFHVAESPSYWQQLFRVFGRGTTAEKRHLSISPSPPKLRKALAIGIHGYFPAPLLQKVLGQPTGTSLRFANGAAAAIQKWTERRGYACEIEKIALEGEGMIENRVNSLWKLLLNWIDQIRNADFILFACHSQGTPVAMMLLARLIDFGCLNPQVRIGMCAMAGVSLGPFATYQSRFLDKSANELFEFSRPQSSVAKAYADALTICLRHHVRIMYIGSIDDQLVSLESALFTTVSHPYIYRAVFVDGRIHAPGFITSLVGLACKLRNLGISDHGLIRELSGPLAGSLYSGEGHSRIYEDQAVYELAVEHAIETANLAVDVAVDTKDYELPSTANSNPYFLPWAMRGVLEEEFVRSELSAETDDLLQRFESWKPNSKVLKDVKFRLEAVRSKL